jgi:hypothetical protein
MSVVDEDLFKFPVRTYHIACGECAPDWGTCGPIIPAPMRHAHYQCLQCDEVWLGYVGPTECPTCGYRYAVWLKR